MLDVRPVAYIVPVAEQPISPITPIVQIDNIGDETARVTGLFRIYRTTTDQLLYTSEILPTTMLGHTSANVAALTPWNPPAPADADYFILFNLTAVNGLVPDSASSFLGAYVFDVTTVPMGPVPAGHHTTHELGGMDEVDITGLSGLLADAQTPLAHAASHEAGGSDEISLCGLTILSELPQTLTDQAAIDWNLALGGAAKVTLGGDRTLNEASNKVNGAHYSLRIIQDGTGTRLLTWHATYRFPGGVEPALSAAVNNIDILLFVSRSEEHTSNSSHRVLSRMPSSA